MRRHLIVTAVLVTAITAGLWLVTKGTSTGLYLSVAELERSRPSGEVRLGGRVLSSSKQGETLRLVVGDESGSADVTLTLEYSGTQRVTFGPGVTVIVRGSLRDDGVFVVSEFVTKVPRKTGSPVRSAGSSEST